MKSRISQLVNFIKEGKTCSYKDVELQALFINRNWRMASVERALRNRKDIELIYKGVPRKSPVVAYRFIKMPELKKEVKKQEGFLDISRRY